MTDIALGALRAKATGYHFRDVEVIRIPAGGVFRSLNNNLGILLPVFWDKRARQFRIPFDRIVGLENFGDSSHHRYSENNIASVVRQRFPEDSQNARPRRA